MNILNISNQLVHALREEQSKVEADLVIADMGETKRRSSKQEKKDKNIKTVVLSYNKETMLKYLNNVSLNFNLDDVLLRDFESEEFD